MVIRSMELYKASNAEETVSVRSQGGRAPSLRRRHLSRVQKSVAEGIILLSKSSVF